MKTLFTFALAALLTSSTLAAVDAEDLMALTNVHATYKKIDVHLKEGVGKAKITILDMTGKRLHQRNVKANEDLRVPYNLNDLPCAEYQVRITTADEEVIYTVETKEKIEPGPVVYPLVAYGTKLDLNTIKLTVLGLEEAGVDVKIFTEQDDRLVYREFIDEPDGFRKDYKLTGLKVENVYLDITDAKGRNRIINF